MRQAVPPQGFVHPTIGARTRIGDAFIANVGAAVAQIHANRTGAAIGRDPEYLHQLRVGIRRLRSTLHSCRALLRRKDAARFDGRLREALRTLGEARDWDVFECALRSPALQRLASVRAEAARRKARATARSARLRYLPDEVLAWARGRPWRAGAGVGEPLQGFARVALERTLGRLLDAADGIDWRDAPGRHRVRIRVKRLRYGCECFAAAWPEQATQPFLKLLRRLQGVLGELNDIDVQRRLLRQFMQAGTAARPVTAAQRAPARRERELIAALGLAWTAFVSRAPFWRPSSGRPGRTLQGRNE